MKAINWAVTEAVYGRAARRFARRHARAGGKAYRYVLSWAAPGNPYGAAHTVDLPLLFGNEKTWAGAGLLAGATWEDINAQGRELRPCGPASPPAVAWSAAAGFPAPSGTARSERCPR